LLYHAGTDRKYGDDSHHDDDDSTTTAAQGIEPAIDLIFKSHYAVRSPAVPQHSGAMNDIQS
jgi:hypothetical protein